VLRRAQLRSYLTALLYHDTVVQSVDCELGFLWTNCNGDRADVFDHETHQIFENADAPYGLNAKDVVIIFGFESVDYFLTPTAVQDTELRFWVDVVANDASGKRRQDILDIVEERILYRLLSYQDFTDATTGETLTSFMRWVDRDGLRIETRDDSAFQGNFTQRRMRMTIRTKDCIQKTDCDDEVLCFDFKDLTRLDEAC
jgi:hypothetical protein